MCSTYSFFAWLIGPWYWYFLCPLVCTFIPVQQQQPEPPRARLVAVLGSSRAVMWCVMQHIILIRNGKWKAEPWKCKYEFACMCVCVMGACLPGICVTTNQPAQPTRAQTTYITDHLRDLQRISCAPFRNNLHRWGHIRHVPRQPSLLNTCLSPMRPLCVHARDSISWKNFPLNACFYFALILVAADCIRLGCCCWPQTPSFLRCFPPWLHTTI